MVPKIGLQKVRVGELQHDVLLDISAEDDLGHGAHNQQASDNLQVEGSSGGEWMSQNIKVVTYDGILASKKNTHRQQPQKPASKSYNDRVDALSLKSEDQRRHAQNRDALVFPSAASHRDIEGPKRDRMSHSQLGGGHQSGSFVPVPVKIQNLQKVGTSLTSSGNEAEVPRCSSDLKIDINVQAMHLHAQQYPMSNSLSQKAKARTLEPSPLLQHHAQQMPQPAKAAPPRGHHHNIQKHLHMHK